MVVTSISPELHDNLHETFRYLEAGAQHESSGTFLFIHDLFAAAEVFSKVFLLLGNVSHCIAIDLHCFGRNPLNTQTRSNLTIQTLSITFQSLSNIEESKMPHSSDMDLAVFSQAILRFTKRH